MTPAATLYHNTDAQVYTSIISLHLSKVLYHLGEIREPLKLVQEALEAHVSAGSAEEDDPQRIAALAALSAGELKRLQTWLRSFVAQVVSADEAGEKRIPVAAMSAAYQVRRSPVFGHLEMLCRSVGCHVVGVHMVKLGRYKAACKTLMHSCQKWPGMFVGMRVEGVPEFKDVDVPNSTIPPRPTREGEIRRTLGEIIRRDDAEAVEAAVEEGVQALLPTISEEQFVTAWAAREASCTGHPEIRLVEFYDANSWVRPISGSTDPREREVRYIGMSKKPCYLCQLFVDRHPLRFILGGLDGEKPGVGVKRVLDPCWRLRPVGGEEYARILDEMRNVVEGELRAEVERWVSRGSDEEVLGRDRQRGRARAKGKRLSMKRGKPKIQSENSSSSSNTSSDGGIMVAVEPVDAPANVTAAVPPPSLAPAVERITVDPVAKIAPVTHDQDSAAISEDEEEGVKLVHDEEAANQIPAAEAAESHNANENGGAEEEQEGTPVASEEDSGAPAPDTHPPENDPEPEEAPDLIFPTADSDSHDASQSSPFVDLAVTAPSLLSGSPPPPNLIDFDPEFMPFAIMSAVDMSSISTAVPPAHSESPPLSPSSAEFHSETQFLEESEFKLLSPIPEEEDEALVLVNLEAVFVRLADLQAEDTMRTMHSEHTHTADSGGARLPMRARAMSDAERDLLGLDFTIVSAEEPEPVMSIAQITESMALPFITEEDTGKLAPGGYLIPEDHTEESFIAPGGYIIVEAVDSASRGYFVVAAEQAGVTLPGGYFAAEAKTKEAGAFAPGGYLVAEMKGEVEYTTLIPEESGEDTVLEEANGNEEESGKVGLGGYMVSQLDEQTLVAPGGYLVVMSDQGEPAAVTIIDEPRQEEVQVPETVDAPAEHTQTQEELATNAGSESSDGDEGYDVINIEQEREKRPTNDQSTPAVKPASTTAEIPEATSQQDASDAPTSPMIVPSPGKPTGDAGSPDTLGYNTCTLGSSPSSSTHTTLSNGTTLANNSTPTTPRLRSSASLLFSPSLRRASTWATATTAMTTTSYPAITSSISVDNLTLDSRPGTAGGGDGLDSESKSIEIKPAKSGGWFAKRLVRAMTSSNLNAEVVAASPGVDGQGLGEEDAAKGLRRSGSFTSLRPASLRPSTPNGNGNVLSGTAKALLTLRGLQTQVRQKK